MQRLTRRSFLSASMALTAAPALGAARQKSGPSSDTVDVVIVGAGAAGIAAARALTAAGKLVIVCEAAATVGGRCITDSKTFGMPYDRGAHWLHTPEANPLAKLATQSGLDIYPAPPGQRVRIGRRYAREGEMEDLLAAIARANLAIAEAARKADVSCASALPNDLGEWRGTVEFMLGPFASGKDLSDISTVDFSRSVERDVDAFCRQGVGTLLTRLARGLPVRLSTPVSEIDWGARRIVVETASGKINARAVIVTASTNVLAAGKIKFSPALPARALDAIGKLRLGSYERVALELPGNPLGFRSDELVFQKSSNRRTAAVLGNLAGSAVCTVDVAGEFARTLSAKDDGEMAAFALDWLAELYGNDVKQAVRRRHVTRWNSEPWVLGAMSAAAPGAQSARRAIMEPLRDRLWFAGEAAHETMWGTVGGAWQSGARAAAAVLRELASPSPAKQRPKSRPKPRPQRQPPPQRPPPSGFWPWR